MKEIKFRLWKGHSNPKLTSEMISWENLKHGYNLTWVLETYRNGEVMQYTGLKDKNGVEIYEGDIVRDVYSNIGAVTWNLFKWSLYDNKRYWEPVHHDLCEVIGNIYENPELLEVAA